ncbi:MAG: T9SS type A sorting domain-containing protein [Bacteroidetes bacterium]|nr:T9SS type A sorting domain-containing protein [Bacteroidota bacterium]
MKTITFFSLLLLFISVESPAQQVPNNSFENWTSVSFFEEPAGYQTTNFQAFLTIGTPVVTKTTDACDGNYALKMETMGNGADNIPGGVFLGNPGPDGIQGGIPYTDHPDSLKFCLKYDMMDFDTGVLMIFFKFMGLPIGIATYTFYGSQPVYTTVALEIGWVPEMIPDSAAFIMFCSSPDLFPSPGSVAYLDNLQLTGGVTQLPNSSFENWLNIGSEEPDFWVTSNPFTMTGSGVSAEKSTDHVDGLYSLKLINQISIGEDTMSFATNGNIAGAGPAGGSPVSQNPENFSFHYKYSPAGIDTAFAMGMLWRNDQVNGVTILLDSVLIKLPAQGVWTYVEVPFSYAAFPWADTVTIAFAAGNVVDDYGSPSLGSALWIDQVQLAYGPVGINNTDPATNRVFPNPVSDVLRINQPFQEMVTIEICSMEGKLMYSIRLNQAGQPILKADISDLPAGQYIYRVITTGSVTSGKFIKI